MSKFFDKETEFDRDVAQNHADQPLHPVDPPQVNGGRSDEGYLSDYRNRAPFHYIEEGDDGYYYWQYGATMEIEFEISDDIALTDPTVPYVVDVRVNGSSCVDPDTGIADLPLGTMASEPTSNYFTAEQTKEIISELFGVAQQALTLATDVSERAEKMAKDLYSMIGQDPSDGDDYTVIANMPFMVMLKQEQETLVVNAFTFENVTVVDASNIEKQIEVPISKLPIKTPFLAVYNTEEIIPRLMIGFSQLPLEYIQQIVIPQVEEKAQISSHNLALDEEEWKDNNEAE